MGQCKRQRMRHKYKYCVNRKKLNQRVNKTTPKIECQLLKDVWNRHRTVKANFQCMGLADNPNIAIGIPKTRIVPELSEVTEDAAVGATKRRPGKIFIMEQLEEDANAPRQRSFRLPNGVVAQLSYYMDKYGDDYRAMTKDPKNYNQETWKQLRAKINRFKGIPEQYNKYLSERKTTVAS